MLHLISLNMKNSNEIEKTNVKKSNRKKILQRCLCCMKNAKSFMHGRSLFAFLMMFQMNLNSKFGIHLI